MALTSTKFLALLIATTGLAVLGTLWLWNRIRAPRTMVRLARVGMLVVCQITAISVVAVWINNSYGLYTSWSDLLGRSDGGAPVAAGPSAVRASFLLGDAGVQHTFFRGTASGLAGRVMVWTPPQYSQPQYRTARFPVVMLLHGVPGSAQSWIQQGGMPGVAQSLIGSSAAEPFILVIPTITPGGADTDCSDVGSQKVATWLAKDVPQLVDTHFRTVRGARGWGLMGISTGGYCAAKLPLQYPSEFSAGVALDPDNLDGDPGVISDARTRQENSPMWLARHRKPRVSLLLATSAQDKFSKPARLRELQHALRKPAQADVLILPRGGHNWNTWHAMYPEVIPWLSEHLASPGSESGGSIRALGRTSPPQAATPGVTTPARPRRRP